MNCVNFLDPKMVDYIELLNLYAEWNRNWLEFYLNFYSFYLPKQ